MVGWSSLAVFVRTMTLIAFDLDMVMFAGNEEGLFAFHNEHRSRIRGMGAAKRCKKKTDNEDQTEKAVHFQRLRDISDAAIHDDLKERNHNSVGSVTCPRILAFRVLQAEPKPRPFGSPECRHLHFSCFAIDGLAGILDGPFKRFPGFADDVFIGSDDAFGC